MKIRIFLGLGVLLLMIPIYSLLANKRLPAAVVFGGLVNLLDNEFLHLSEWFTASVWLEYWQIFGFY